MPFKPKDSKHTMGDILEPIDFDKTYDKQKELVNGGLDRENLPEEGFGKDQFLQHSFMRHYQTYFKMEEEYVTTTMPSGLTPNDLTLKTAGTSYAKYAGGWIDTTNDRYKLQAELKEGMCQIEMNVWAFMNKPNAGGYFNSGTNSDISWFQFQLVFNGSVVAETDRVHKCAATIHIMANVPCSAGPCEVKVRWRHNGRPNGPYYELGAPLFYYSGGNLLLINRYR